MRVDGVTLDKGVLWMKDNHTVNTLIIGILRS